MELISSLFDLFFDVVLQVISTVPYVVYLLLACFVFALIFNIVHILMGGD